MEHADGGLDQQHGHRGGGTLWNKTTIQQYGVCVVCVWMCLHTCMRATAVLRAAVFFFLYSSTSKAITLLPVLTCLQVPQVLAAHLVVPVLPVSISSAPDVETGADGGGTVACPGPGAAGLGLLPLAC